MRLDSLLPVILIACLIALAYFLTKAVQASQNSDKPEPAPIQLDQSDYGQANNGASANTDTSLDGEESGSADTDEGDQQDYFQAGESDDESPTTNDYRVSTGSSYTPTDDETDNASGDRSASSGSSYSQSSSGSGGGTASRAAPRAGDYLVVAGSYRERVNADAQMRRLHRAGFPDASVEIFDRGTYALVVVDQYSAYSQAKSRRDQLRAVGFDAYIHQVD
ncbi:MAG: SPOR domain-containing protein [Bacteroidota bacterium]